MNTKRKTRPTADPSRVYTPVAKIHGRRVERGTELTVAGIRGRVAFVAHVAHESGVEWLDVATSRGFRRSIRPEAVKRVHTRHRLGVLADV